MEEVELPLMAFKLKNGEEIVGLLEKKDSGKFTINKPMIVIKSFNVNIQKNFFILHPWTLMQTGESVTIERSDVIFPYEVSDSLRKTHSVLWEAFATTRKNTDEMIEEDDRVELEAETTEKKGQFSYVDIPRNWNN